MGLYDRYVVPVLINLAMKNKMATDQRRKFIPRAKGKILEVGFGSGLNLPYYGDGAEHITGIDPSEGLRKWARRRIEACPIPFEHVGGSAEEMPFDGREFDTVVVTWSLCSIPDAAAALSEMKRVLKPDGKLIFTEHGRAPDEKLARWQDRINPYWGKISGGCNINRPMDKLVREAGFNIEHLEAEFLDGPRLLAFHYSGIAS